MKQLFTTAVLLCLAPFIFGQANTTLSNLLSPTAINQHLLPGSNNVRDLGSASLNWRSFYLKGSMWKGSQRFLSNSGVGNTFLGIASGVSLTAGNSNTAIGDSALYASTSSYYNTAMGYMALSRTSGGSNTAIGYVAMRDNTSGFNNTALGYGAMMRITTGAVNVAIGNDALINNSRGSNNIAIGMFTLVDNNESFNTAVGVNSLIKTTASQNNTALGFRAGYNYNNGYNNVFLGANTDVNGEGYYNVIAIGQATVCTAPSQVTIGNPATNSYRAYTNWSNISDGRYKKNLQENVPGLSFINQLRPVTYTLNASELDQLLNKGRDKENQPSSAAATIMHKAMEEKEALVQTGFVAQEVEQAAKRLNYNFSGVDAPKNTNDVYGLRYSDFVVPLVKAVQELDSANKVLKEQNNNQQQQIDELRKMVLDLTSNYNNPVTSISGYLAQATPNPANGTTQIYYTLPAGGCHAQLLVSDAIGKTIKAISLNHSGSVHVNTASLSSGLYNYTLYIDGKQVDTKRLVIVR